ncbi:hypothetical protein DL96DRAFT_1617797 [Flagelloscypha sp. PMI_526]|nr:hypothetical protein DL96DRAFT_1617797 [Flagelloscypha sp. PMI_526]
MKSLFQGLRHLSSRVHRNPTLDFLRGFENITELLLEPREPLFHTPFTWHGLPYPHVMETWRVVGPRLTTLNITLRHGFEGIINVLPPSHAISEPLPLLECMILEILLISPKPPYEISAEQKRRDTVVQVMHRISALYLGSRKLQELSLKSYNKRESDGFDTELLSILLPSSQGQVHYPALTRFRICLPLYDQIPTWDGPLMEFLSVHSTRLKMLQLRTANGETVKRWLGFNFPVLDKLEIDILREDVIGFRKLSEKFPSLVQNSLTALTIGVLGSNSELRNLVENIGSLAPHLDTLRIGGGFRLWPEFFFTLSIELPELYSLMVEVSRLEADSGQGFMSCPNFLREVVCHLPRKEALNAWKLFDIGVRSDVLKFEEVAVLMNGLAELIPSVQSFFMHGYTMDV